MLAGNSEATSCIVSALSKLLDSYPYKNKSDVLCPSEIISSLTSKTDIHIMSDMQTNHKYICAGLSLSPGRQQDAQEFLINYIVDQMPSE